MQRRDHNSLNYRSILPKFRSTIKIDIIMYTLWVAQGGGTKFAVIRFYFVDLYNEQPIRNKIIDIYISLQVYEK